MRISWVVPLLSLFASLALISGCALQPAHNAEAAKALAQIRVAPMAEREGQIMRLALQRRFDPQALALNSLYDLEATLETSVVLILPKDGARQSARGTLSLRGTLTNAAGQVLWSGTKARSALFLQHELPSLSIAAQEDLWHDLADLIAQDLALTLMPLFTPAP